MLLSAVGTGLWRASKAWCFVLAGEVTCRAETEEPIVALTLDDGPTPEGTAAAIAALERGGARATFFLIGRHIERHPGEVRRILAAGHEVGNHSWSHKRMMGRSSAWYDEEIARTGALLHRLGARGPRLFRPPFGKKLFGLPLAARRQGHRMIMWDVGEADLADPRAYADHIVARARPGSIILMHVMYRGNATGRTALPLVLDGLRRKGLRAVTVGELLARTEERDRTARRDR
ncbi:MAG TPA: polysaccharide deacetylase family protein [Allosphingosinicella sp.]